MNYNKPELRDRLASEYVLGTLHGLARRRFEHLKKYDADLKKRVFAWEQRLAPISDSIPPLKPPAKIWKRIEQRLGFSKPSIAESAWQHVSTWRFVSLAGIAASIALAFMLSVATQTSITINQYVAVISNQQQQASWLFTMQSGRSNATVKVLNQQQLPTGKDFELWMLPKDSQPISLGLLQASSDTVLKVSTQMAIEILKANGLAVSLEPAGGSTTGLPTGPVLYQGAVQPI